MKEQWRDELAELLARAEAEGRDLTTEEWHRFCELLPHSERNAMAQYIISTLSLGRAAALHGASSPGLQEPAKG